MDNIKIGFIGYGRHAKANLYPSLKVLGYKVAAVATTHDESAAQASKDYTIPAYYSNHVEMFKKEKFDCVFICAKPEQHVRLVKDALNAKVHVFVEKNLGFNAKEAKEVDDLAKKVKKNVMVGFMKRFAPTYNKAYEIINSKDFGDITSLSMLFTSRNFVSNSKEYLLFAVIHYIDMIRYYCGEVVEVKGFESIQESTISMSFSLKAKNGALITLYISASPSWEKGAQEICITGTKGYVRVYGNDNIRYHLDEGQIDIPRWQTLAEKEITYSTLQTMSSGGLQDLYQNGFIGEIDHFIKSVQNNTTPINNSEENVNTMKIYDMMIASLNK